ncbi:MAG TPA: hypothetical protein ENG70_02055 [Candidatus Cloacimonetes bacterium]|nr:hypothetical protein [Candidatus Cloacimonadota bacterium]HEX37632.1 hypothetical protein [Candidatus Cloacimonadota bacterium]
MIKKCSIIVTLLVIFLSGYLYAEFWADFESGLNFSGHNNVRVPGNLNPPAIFSLQKDIGSKASPFFRARFSYTFSKRHTISILLAPFTKTYKGDLKQNILFNGKNFSATYETEARYRFNSWRLSYRWDFVNSKKITIGIGLTAKIRDAEIYIKGKDASGGLPADEVESSKKNVGFVPLINFLLAWKFTQCMDLRIEGDALAAPQGRVEDIFAGWTGFITDKLKIKLGYRLLEGGADNDEVYNFALFHYIVLGLMFQI